jgi:hypothetical protein
MSCAILGKGFNLGALGSFDHDFIHIMHFCCFICVDNNKNEDLVFKENIYQTYALYVSFFKDLKMIFLIHFALGKVPKSRKKMMSHFKIQIYIK